MGNPIKLILSAGQRHDISQAPKVLADTKADYVIADKAFDSQAFLDLISELGAQAVIPPSSHRKEQRDYDKELYKERHLIECFIGKLKYFRRIFSRFDKLASRYLSFIHFAATLIWLK